MTSTGKKVSENENATTTTAAVGESIENGANDLIISDDPVTPIVEVAGPPTSVEHDINEDATTAPTIDPTTFQSPTPPGNGSTNEEWIEVAEEPGKRRRLRPPSPEGARYPLQNVEARVLQMCLNAQADLNALQQELQVVQTEQPELKTGLQEVQANVVNIQSAMSQMNALVQALSTKDAAAAHVLNDLLIKTGENHPHLSHAMAVQCDKRITELEAANQEAKFTVSRAGRQNKQLQKAHTKAIVQQNKLYAEVAAKGAAFWEAQEQHPTKQSDSLKSKNRSRKGTSPSDTTFIIRPSEETKAKTPSELSSMLRTIIQAPAKLEKVKYSHKGNLKIQVRKPTETTNSELAVLGYIIPIVRYHKLVMDSVPCGDFLDEKGSLRDPEDMKRTLEYHNGIQLAQAPRALIPKQKSGTPRTAFSMAVYLPDRDMFSRVMKRKTLKTSYSVCRVRDWDPKPSTFKPKPSGLSLYKDARMAGFEAPANTITIDMPEVDMEDSTGSHA